MSYEVPLHYGLVDRATMLDQRYSKTMNEDTFLRENMSVWTGNNSEAWLDSHRINKLRKLLRYELEAQKNPPPGVFYIIACDIGRYHANTAIMVIKVYPTTSDTFKKKVVYTENIHGANYITEQAPRIKKLIQLYAPREVVIDGNGRTKSGSLRK